MIAAAHEDAGVDPRTITFVEAHGTGTPLGDPIEVEALTRAFRRGTTDTGFCALGAVKASIGHLDSAAGIAGLIKTVLALERGQLPPSINFERANSEIDFAATPFYVNETLVPWESDGMPRRAGVSSFGIGGTNAHLVLDEPPAREPGSPSRGAEAIVLSARTPTALAAASRRLADELERRPELDLPNVAYTLQLGRRAFPYRHAIVARDRSDAVDRLRAATEQVGAAVAAANDLPVIFLFPGQGAQHPGMAVDLYRTQPVFRSAIDEACELLLAEGGPDLRSLLLAAEAPDAAHALTQTSAAQPALFVVEHALARLLTEWGLAPAAMLGHSVGEYVAAAAAGVFSWHDALQLVAARGRLMQSLPAGAMLAVSLGESELAARLDGELALAAVNGHALSVASGPLDEIERLEQRLVREDVACQRLHTSHAFHSAMTEPILAEFEALVRSVPRHVPRRPYISNLTGTWATDDDAVDPRNWALHLRRTVRFHDGLATLLANAPLAIVEVGPGRALARLAQQHEARHPAHVIASTLPRPDSGDDALESTLAAVGRLWAAGASVDWRAVHGDDRRLRVSLPTYPFERQRYWVDAPSAGRRPPEREAAAGTGAAAARGALLDAAVGAGAPRAASGGRGRAAVACAPRRGPVRYRRRRVARRGGAHRRDGLRGQRLLRRRRSRLHSRSGGSEPTRPPSGIARRRRSDAGPDPARARARAGGSVDPALRCGSMRCSASSFRGLLELAAALSRHKLAGALELTALTNGVHDITNRELLAPERALVAAACRTIGQEFRNVRCRTIDVVLPSEGAPAPSRLARALAADLAAPGPGVDVAYRHGTRLVLRHRPVRLSEPTRARSLRRGGTYLVTGGLGNLGLVVAEFLTEQADAKLVLTGRSPFPAPGRWDEWLAGHPENERTAQRIRALRALEAKGAEVLAVPGDVASPASMLHVLDLAHERFGPVHGVVHAAGDMSADAFFEIGQVGDENVERSLGPKARGLIVLHRLLRSDPVELWLLVSSVSTVLGGVGYAAYAAGNAYLEAFAQAQRRRSKARWVSIAWDTCRFDGVPDGAALGPKDVADALARVLAQPRPHLAVSVTDLNVRIRRWVSPTAEAAPQGHPRVEPAAANGAAEIVLTELYRDVLGVNSVRGDDDFFADLGGDSLLATQLASRIRARFRVELPLRAIFDSPTPKRLAETVKAAAAAPSAAGAASEATAIPRAARRVVVAPDESSSVAI